MVMTPDDANEAMAKLLCEDNELLPDLSDDYASMYNFLREMYDCLIEGVDKDSHRWMSMENLVWKLMYPNQ